MSGAPDKPAGTAVVTTTRLLVESVRRYAERFGWHLECHSHDWILTLRRGNRSHLIHGYDLGLNRSAAAKIAHDKAATHDVLAAAKVASVPHRVFLHPRFLDFVPVAGNWADMLVAFAAFGCDVVIKDNEGTGGMEVFRARSVRQLEQHAHALFQIARAVALSPYLDIQAERRFVMLDEACLFAYGKERLAVTGDGRQTIGQLLAATRLPVMPELDLQAIPADGAKVPLQWRHNLGRGAIPVPFDPAQPDHATELALARAAMQALGLRFASVDVTTVEQRPFVLEVNAGVMLEVLARGHNAIAGAVLVDQIYHRVLDQALAEPG